MSTRCPVRPIALAAILLFLANPAAVDAAYTSAVVGSTATMTGDAASDTLTITQAAGCSVTIALPPAIPDSTAISISTPLSPATRRSRSATGIININAGDGNDTIALGDGINLRGTIDGGAGIDTLDYSAYTTASARTSDSAPPG